MRYSILLVVMVGTAWGSAWEQIQSLRPMSIGQFELFGYQVAATDQWLAVSAVSDRDCNELYATGRVFLYRRDGDSWVDWQQICPPSSSDANFGVALAISDDLLAVTSQGTLARVYVYRRGNGDIWQVEGTLEQTDPGLHSTQFGTSIAIDGDLVAVGDVSAEPGGAVSVFDSSGGTWPMVSTVLACDGGGGFGISLAFSAGDLLVGAPYAYVAGYPAAGAVYVLQASSDGWVETQKLVASDPGRDDTLGRSIAVIGEELFAGAPTAVIGGKSSGGVKRFLRTGAEWVEIAGWVRSANPGFGQGFGIGLASGDGRLMVRDVPAVPPATVRVFDDPLSLATESSKITPSPSPYEYGMAVVSGLLIVGDASIDSATGSVYVYRQGADCNGNGVIDAVDLATGASADCNENRVPDECDIFTGAVDCDGDGKLDACAIADGTATDCDENGIPDSCDIVAGASDANRDGILDSCQCLADLTGDGIVGLDDLGIVLAQFGSSVTALGDIDDDGDVDLGDLGIMLAAFGQHCR